MFYFTCNHGLKHWVTEVRLLVYQHPVELTVMETNGRPVCSDGLAPPIEEWQKAINDQLEKIRKLEETYDNELILKKVDDDLWRIFCAFFIGSGNVCLLYRIINIRRFVHKMSHWNISEAAAPRINKSSSTVTSAEGRRLCFYLCLSVCLSVR